MTVNERSALIIQESQASMTDQEYPTEDNRRLLQYHEVWTQVAILVYLTGSLSDLKPILFELY